MMAHSSAQTSEISPREVDNSFQTTRMNAEQSLMGTIRTALSLIGFGFTIFQFFKQLQKLEGAEQVLRQNAARNLGLTLAVVGVMLLVLGVIQHYRFMRELSRERRDVLGEAFVKSKPFPFSINMAAAVVLAGVGLLAILSMLVRIGPF
jgi:putative membrane protein